MIKELEVKSNRRMTVRLLEKSYLFSKKKTFLVEVSNLDTFHKKEFRNLARAVKVFACFLNN